MTLKFLLTFFILLSAASAFDYSKCTNLVNENRISYEAKNCSVTLCLVQFSCDFGAGPILMNAACKIPEKSNQCPSIQECIGDTDVEFKELDGAQPLNSLPNSSSGNGAKVMGL